MTAFFYANKITISINIQSPESLRTTEVGCSDKKQTRVAIELIIVANSLVE